MNLKINTYKFGERPDVTKPDIDFYKALGEEGIRNMVSKHYDLLVQSPIKDLFPSGEDRLAIAKRNSADFLIQICGGPDYFNQHRGQPMMVNRHASFSITHDARVIWLSCYQHVLLELDIPEHLILSFWNYLNVFSIWMVNTNQHKHSL